jgi:two-component system nitrogen regulation sensor histidine kinase GlnL
VAALEHSAPSALAHFDPADLLDALSTGIVMLDAQLCPMYANVAAQDLLAFSLTMARGRPFTDLLHEPESLGGILRRVLMSGESIADRELAVRPAGAPREARTLDVTLTPLDGLTGRHLLLELADTTQRQRITRENDLLARLDGSRLMVRQLAHEIKNPLGGLRGAAQLLERELLDPSLREYTRVIISEADRLTNLLDSMLGPGRPPAKQLVNVHELLERVYHLLRSEASEGVTIDRDYDPSLPPVTVDPNHIIQAMLNLGRNAIQALSGEAVHAPRLILRTRAMSNVSVGAHRHRLAASIQFEDNGPGVLTEIRDTIFYPLVSGRADGTGLGLGIAQDLVSRHGGLIEFDSAPGRTIFLISLPMDSV